MATERTGNADLDASIEQWLSWDKNETTRTEIIELIKSNNIAELKKRLLKRISFGTAGLRARMGAGLAYMNDVTVIQATQGILRYLEATRSEELKKSGVIIGYDGRHNSHRFAQLTATIFVNADVSVYLYSRINATPYVPYAVTHYGYQCGIMITASHNPKDDNGYKVYWFNGAQIASPLDEHLAESIAKNLSPWPSSWDTEILDNNPLVKDPYEEIFAAYNEDLQHLCYQKELNQKSPLKFTYTAMHGVGFPFAVRAMEEFGFNPPIPVKEQVESNPDFPTVKYPNPEEGEGALKLSMETADSHGSTVILANDPDADRLAVAEKVNGHWKIFTGNELGALFGWWLFHSFKKSNPNFPTTDIYMLASTVSSKILEAIAQKENFNFIETLTGFKWMGNWTCKLIKEGKKVLFAFEEAIGFMCGDKVVDKDGLSAAAVMAEMATWLSSEGKTLTSQLEEIYQTYGYYISLNSYYISHDTSATERMFDELCNYNGSDNYPRSCGPYAICHVRDLNKGYDSSTPDGQPLLPTCKSSQMITFTFECGCVATLRTSGTEPKIKYYTEHCPNPNRGLDRAGVLKELQDIVKCIEKYFYQPEKFGFQART